MLLQQLHQLSRILIIDEPEVYLQHRTSGKNSLRSLADVAGLEPADRTRRLCHVMLERFPVILRPWKTLQSPLPQESVAVELDLVHQSRLGCREWRDVIIPTLHQNLLVWSLDRVHGPDEPPCRILRERSIG